LNQLKFWAVTTFESVKKARKAKNRFIETNVLKAYLIYAKQIIGYPSFIGENSLKESVAPDNANTLEVLAILYLQEPFTAFTAFTVFIT